MSIILPFVIRTPHPHLDPIRVRVDDGSMSTNPMRRLVYRGCNTCGFEWVQPAETGLCPRCHDGDTVIFGVGMCVAPYRG